MMNIGFSNPRVLRRFVILMVLLTVGAVIFTTAMRYLPRSESAAGDGAVPQDGLLQRLYAQFLESPPGDFETRQGDIFLGDRKYDQALERFDAALEVMPDHRGALMGRAIVFLKTEQWDEAEAAFTYLIEFLGRTLEPDDPTGRGTLAAALANRGILYDLTGRHERALVDYVYSLRVDDGAVDGPSLIDQILYNVPKPSTVRDRARYLYEQFQLPEEQRVLRMPERDAKERMYKP